MTARFHHRNQRSRILTGLFVLAVLRGIPVHADVILKELSAALPPEVIQLNHNYNLRLLRNEHDAMIQEINGRAGDASRACGNNHACSGEVWGQARASLAAENQRYSVAVEAETMNYEQALTGAQGRLEEEEKARKKQLRQQRKELEDRQDEIDSRVAKESRDAITTHAQAVTSIDEIIQSGDEATVSSRTSPFGDVSSRFRARRREYAQRSWAEPSTPSATVHPEEACVGAAAASRPCRERVLTVQIRRLEEMLSVRPNQPEIEERLHQLREDLNAVRAGTPAPDSSAPSLPGQPSSK